MLGRYHFAVPEEVLRGELRPLRDLNDDDSKESGDVVCVCLKQCFDHVIQNLSAREKFVRVAENPSQSLVTGSALARAQPSASVRRSDQLYS